MPELFFCQRAEKPADFLAPLGANQAALLCKANRRSLDSLLSPGTVFSLTDDAVTLNMASSLNRLDRKEGRILCNVVQACGNELLPLASFFDRYFSDHNIDKINTAIGAASTAASIRLDSFEQAVVEYQKSLNTLWRASRENHGVGNADLINQLSQRTSQNFDNLKSKYSVELNRFSPQAWRNKNRGDAFSNARRGIRLATKNPRSAKMDSRLEVHSRYQVSGMAILSRLINKVGNGAVAFDAVMRAVKVKAVKEAGGDWMRESVRQLSGFGLGGAAGIYVGQATFGAGAAIAVEAGLLVSGPIGWLVLGGIFAASLGAGYLAGGYGDKFGQGFSNGIMENSLL
ncbi:MAG: hypothetical protein P8077_06110 [Gammaproteobacteria bacterium]